MGKRHFSTDNSWINERRSYSHLTPFTVTDLFARIVQLGTGEAPPALPPILSSEVHLGDRITALPLNSAYVIAPPAHREMSHVTRSMPQPLNIFRFTSLLATSW